MSICANQTAAGMCRPCVCREELAAEQEADTSREVGVRANDNGGRTRDAR